MKNPILLAALCLGVASRAFSLIEVEINDRVPVEVELSTNATNRICIEGGSIEKIVADDALIDINLDELTGQAFVSLHHEIPLEGTGITVISSEGSVQDIHATSSHKPSELLVLRESDWMEESEGEFTPLDFKAHSIEFLSTLIGGGIPHGYGLVSHGSVDPLFLPKGLKGELLRVLEGPFDRVAVYTLLNASRKPIALHPASFTSGGEGWAFLGSHEMSPRDSIYCIISYKKGASE